jgi:hypothetical protein
LSKLRLKLSGGLLAEQQKLYVRLQDTMNYYPKYGEKLGGELKEPEAKVNEHRNAKVKVTNLLYFGVKIAIGKFSSLFNDKQSHIHCGKLRWKSSPRPETEPA